ncbi:MAG TPA: site-2 protease family protein [Gemmatimonadales bacterium]|nr:site-2 protease family protein [Gemmatimonadales bacterium]
MSLTPYLLAWRTTALHDREVIDALVDPAHAAPSPELAGALAEWSGNHYWSQESDGRHLVLTRARTRRPERWSLHAALFFATLVTTTLAGAVIVGTIPYDGLDTLNTAWHTVLAGLWRPWIAGLAFSVPLLAILLAHELGHYVTARRYALDVSPPYFIPVPLFPVFIGTMGAFIRLRTLLSDRRQLIDVGAAGPIVGFLVALPALVVGLVLSHPVAPSADVHGLMLFFGGDPALALGDSSITWVLWRAVFPHAAAVAVHPLAAAGWFGIFVTMLNLLPISQLDGGHILFAALPAAHRRAALAFWLAIVVLGFLWVGWTVWGVLVLVLSRGRFGHPPVLDAYRPLPPSRRRLAWVSLALFALTFMPVPFGT